jgi:hypothetical protein
MELNQCRYNHMGMDVRMRSEPSYFPRLHGKCRNNEETCEDCMVTPLEQIYSIHYTQCRKPWNCIGEPKLDKSQKMNIPTDSVHLDHCLELQTIWHSMRYDLEVKLEELSKKAGTSANVKPRALAEQTYKHTVFRGHCTDNGGDYYIPIDPALYPHIVDMYKR